MRGLASSFLLSYNFGRALVNYITWPSATPIRKRDYTCLSAARETRLSLCRLLVYWSLTYLPRYTCALSLPETSFLLSSTSIALSFLSRWIYIFFLFFISSEADERSFLRVKTYFELRETRIFPIWVCKLQKKSWLFRLASEQELRYGEYPYKL